ncbi:hypothetical protein AB0C93_29085 [Streptomyces sp. NPDC048518]|uniref:hypothetical protein n=1 Tax=Streptomyces sp. NPDC048518 TaxID=3155029 RepID=UPI0033C7A46A
MDFEALRSAEFKLLDDAVDDWSKMVKKLDDLKRDAEKGLSGAAKKANWAGYNATVSREFIAKTAEEFADAHTQARTVRNILKDTLGELRKHQEGLKGAIAAGVKKDLTVVASGGGFTVKAKDGSKTSQGEVDALRDDIQRYVDRATKSDDSASKVLTAIADHDRLGFSDANYGSRDAAAAAVKEADELSHLAKKNPSDLTVAEFDRLNSGLKKYADDELFSERFATKLGAKGTLEFWANINDPNANPELNYARHGKFDDLQKNLSLTLASATQSDALGMTEWTSKVVDLGNRPIGNGGPMGFQVMSNLMRWGNFDDQFLTDYGSRLMETEKRLTHNGTGEAWRRTAGDIHLNRTGSDTGWDPVTGFTKGLSNSPAAATEFFNDRFISKDDENNPFKGQNKTNFEYLFEEREWPSDVGDDGKPSNAGRNNLALALEAATTGHPAGELPTAETAPHNAEQAKLMESIASSIAKNPTNLTEHSYMSDSIGQIASEYLPDIARATSDADDGNGSVPRLFPISGTVAEMSHSEASRLLVSIGQNPEGNAAVEVGQKAYMANLLEYHMNPDLPHDQSYRHSAEDTIKEITRRSAEIGGTLAIGRQEAILGPANADGGDYDNALSQKKNLVSGAIGTGIGVGASLVASPVTGAAIGGVGGTVSSIVLEYLFKDSESKTLQDLGKDSGDLWEDSKDKNTKLHRLAAEAAAEVHGARYKEKVEEWTRVATTDGFNDASTAGGEMDDDLTTEIQS